MTSWISYIILGAGLSLVYAVAVSNTSAAPTIGHSSNAPTLGLILFPKDRTTVDTITPTLTVDFGDLESRLDLSTLRVRVDGIDHTKLFLKQPEMATASMSLSGGPHNFKATVKDKSGQEYAAQSSFTVSVFEVFPNVAPTTGPAQLTVQFQAQATYTDGGILHYRWDFEGDGTFDTDDPGERTYSYTYTKAGTFNALLEVVNDQNEVRSATIPITVTGIPPWATVQVNPSNGAVPLTVSFAGRGRDSDGKIVKYEWDFDGDGVFEFTSDRTGNTSHTYSTEGTFPAIFRVTDSSGLTDMVFGTPTTVRVGPKGSPTAMISSRPVAQDAPAKVKLYGKGKDRDGKITLYEWDFDGDGIFDASSSDSGDGSFTYEAPGNYAATFRVTDESGLTGVAALDVTINLPFTLTIVGNTCNPQHKQFVRLKTVLGGTIPLTIFIRDAVGQVVRTLVDQEHRTAGTYEDIWDCKNSNGDLMREEQKLFVVAQYQANGKTITIDQAEATGGKFFPLKSALDGNAIFNPLKNESLNITFTLKEASEISGSIRLLSNFQEVVRLVERKTFGSGDHTIYWDGTNSQGRHVLPPQGDQFVVGLLRYSLPDNAIFVETAPKITKVAATPNFFDPTTGDFISPKNPMTRISYDLSRQSTVTVQVVNTRTNKLVKTIDRPNQTQGSNELQWDGRNEQGIFADSGLHRLALKAIDANGNQSIVRYVLVFVVH